MYLRDVRRSQYEQVRNSGSFHGTPWAQRKWTDDKDLDGDAKNKFLCYNFGDLIPLPS